MKLVIATPFYEVKAYSPYVSALVKSMALLAKCGIECEYYELSGDSYVDRAKNELVHMFLKSDNTHILMIDSDMAWDQVGFVRVVKDAIAGCEVVGAAYPCKNNWEFYGCIPIMEDGQYKGKEFDDKRLLEMHCIPGGFICYSREAFERARPNLDSYINPANGDRILEAFKCNIETNNPKTREQLKDTPQEQLIEMVLRMQKGLRGEGGRIGEDVYFQQRFKEMGGKVWLEPNVEIQHYGVKAWEGNYHEHLLRQKIENERIANEQATESVEELSAALKAVA